MLDIQLYTLKPKLSGAVQFDGSLEQAQEILQWISTATHEEPVPVRSTLEINANYRSRRTTTEPPSIKAPEVHALVVSQPRELRIGVGDFLVFEDASELGGRFKVYNADWFNDVYEPNAPIIDTMNSVYYIARRPDGVVWFDSVSLEEVKKRVEEKWDGSGDLTFEKVTQKTTKHAARVDILESI